MNVDEDIPFTVPRQGVEWNREGDTLRIRFEGNALVRWSVRWLGVDPSKTLIGYIVAFVVLGSVAAFLRVPSWLLSTASMFPIILMYATRSSRIEIEITTKNIVRRTYHDIKGQLEDSFIYNGACDVQVESRPFGGVIRLETSEDEVQIESDSHSEVLQLRRALEDYFDALESKVRTLV